MGRLSNRNAKAETTKLIEEPTSLKLTGTSYVHVFVDVSGNVTQIKKKHKDRLPYYIDPALQTDFVQNCVIGISGGGLKQPYRFSTGTTESDPTSGYLKFNSTYDVSKIYISSTSSGSTLTEDISDWINNIKLDGTVFLKIFNPGNNNFSTYDIISRTYNTDWWTFEVLPIVNSFYQNDGNIYFTFEQSSCTYGIALGVGDNSYARAVYS